MVVAFGMEEPAREHGAVPLRIAQVETGDRHPRLDPGLLGGVGVELDPALDAREGADGAREAGMVDEEDDSAVNRIDPIVTRVGMGQRADQGPGEQCREDD